jgi:hypothetical protein
MGLLGEVGELSLSPEHSSQKFVAVRLTMSVVCSLNYSIHIAPNLPEGILFFLLLTFII